MNPGRLPLAAVLLCALAAAQADPRGPDPSRTMILMPDGSVRPASELPPGYDPQPHYIPHPARTFRPGPPQHHVPEPAYPNGPPSPAARFQNETARPLGGTGNNGAPSPAARMQGVTVPRGTQPQR